MLVAHWHGQGSRWLLPPCSVYLTDKPNAALSVPPVPKTQRTPASHGITRISADPQQRADAVTSSPRHSHRGYPAKAVTGWKQSPRAQPRRQPGSTNRIVLPPGTRRPCSPFPGRPSGRRQTPGGKQLPIKHAGRIETFCAHTIRFSLTDTLEKPEFPHRPLSSSALIGSSHLPVPDSVVLSCPPSCRLLRRMRR